jgi:predicted GIY-YIG superfamily endonuclease
MRNIKTQQKIKTIHQQLPNNIINIHFMENEGDIIVENGGDGMDVANDVMTEIAGKHVCYIIANNGNKTYNGYTNNFPRRLRQHNGELVGGAKATSVCRGEWKPIAIITGFADNHEALSCEWRIKHPTNERRRPAKYNGLHGRIKSLNIILRLLFWTSKGTGISSGKPYVCYVREDLRRLLDETDLPKNVKIRTL